jgi:hypothetical protein
VSQFARQIIDKVPIIDADHPEHEDFVFSVNGRKPLNSRSKYKARLDRKVLEALKRSQGRWSRIVHIVNPPGGANVAEGEIPSPESRRGLARCGDRSLRGPANILDVPLDDDLFDSRRGLSACGKGWKWKIKRSSCLEASRLG